MVTDVAARLENFLFVVLGSHTLSTGRPYVNREDDSLLLLCSLLILFLCTYVSS